MDGDVLTENWRWTTLGEVVDPNSRAIVSGPFGSNIGSRFFVEKGVPVIRGNNLTTDALRFIDDGFVFVTHEKADELRNCDAVVDDLVFTAAGSLGQVGLIPKAAKYPVGGGTPRTTEPAYWNERIHHWATPKDLSRLAVPVLLETERRITDAGLAQISSGLLPAGTVLLSSRAPIGYLAIAEVPVAINQGFIAMKPQKGVSNLFLLLWARSAHEEILSHANGSTFLEISKANFRPISVAAPPTAVFGAFDGIARPLYRKIVSNEHESRTLAALRDTLLPKLISGELRVVASRRFD